MEKPTILRKMLFNSSNEMKSNKYLLLLSIKNMRVLFSEAGRIKALAYQRTRIFEWLWQDR